MERTGILLITLLSGFSFLKYSPPSLHQLIFNSEVILLGEIVGVDDKTFEVEVAKSINYGEALITIRKFEGWTCGKRWGAYEVGQKAVFFLGRKEDQFYLKGGGNEGEMPVHTDKVYVHRTTLYSRDPINDFEVSQMKIEDHGYNNPYNKGYALDLKEFWEAVVSLKKCFHSDFSIFGKMTDIQFCCPPTEVEDLKQKNVIYSWAVKDL